MENINKFVKTKIKQLNNSNKQFKDIFKIIHNCDNNKIFSEISDGYKIKKTTYQEIKQLSIKLGNYFNDKLTNIDKGSYVGLMMNNSNLWIASFWGLLMSGYKPMLINIRLGKQLNDDIIQLLNIKYIICDNDYQLNCNIFNINNLNNDYNNITNINLNIDCFPWENEIALSSSATSLNIKICIYKGEDIASQLTNTKYILNHNSMMKAHYKGSLKVMTFLPFYHIFGLIATYFWFCFFNRTLVFLKDYGNETILKTARKHKVTHIFAVPMLWNTISKELIKEISLKDEKTKKKFRKGIKLSQTIQNISPKAGLWISKKMMKDVQNQVFGDTIKFLISGGGYIAPTTLTLINGIGYPLYNGYGMSEIGITSVELRRKNKYRNIASIGKPFPTVNYKIENDILLVKGSSICSKIITKNQEYEIDHSQWFQTNDIVKQDKKGFYYVLGRNDDVVISSSGEKINPDIIEKNIMLLNVNRFCVMGIEEEGINKLSLVVEIPQGISKLKTQKIIEEINNNNFNFEKVYFTYDKIANDSAIKVSRSILLKKIQTKEVKLLSYNEFKDSNNYDQNIINEEIYNNVINIFSEVLKKDINTINPNDHFIFDLGGSSLEYLTLLIKLKEKFEIDFNFINDDNCYTVKEIVDIILKRGK